MLETSLIVAVLVGLVEVFKQVGMPSRVAPLLAVILGVGSAFLVGAEATVGLTVFNGLLYGLMASGLYSGVKATVVGTHPAG